MQTNDEIAKDIRAKVDDLNEAITSAARNGLCVVVDTVERRFFANQPEMPYLSVRILQAL